MADGPATQEPHARGIEIVVNARSGTDRGPDPATELRAALPGARIVALEEGDDVERALRHAARAGAIGVCGGDGTVNAAATVALEVDCPLLVVPGGTLNHFARAIAIDETADAVAALTSGRLIEVDVGAIGERRFLNTASFGVYSDLVDRRERLEGRIGKWPAFVVAAARVLRDASPCDVEIDGAARRVWLVFVGNCCYEPRGAVPRGRRHLADGLLDVRIVEATQRWSRLRFVIAAVCRRTDRSRVFEQRSVAGLSVRSLDGPIRLACDGETFDGPAELTFGKAPRRLRVFVPPER